MKRSILCLALAAILLSSCFIPDNYDLTISIKKNGSYTFEYDGELNYAPVMEAFIEGEVDDEVKVDLQEVIDGLKEKEEFKKVKDLGKGKIKVEVLVKNDAGVDYYFLEKELKYFSIEYNNDNELTVSGFEVQEDSKAEIEKFSTRLEGKITVVLPKKMKVTSHNADKKEEVNKKNMAYIWELDYTSEKPEIIIKL